MVGKLDITIMKINRIIEDALGENLVGHYLHGSLVMGCFHPDTSDIDLLVVVKEDVPFKTKQELTEQFLMIDNELPAKGVELSIVLKDVLDPFQYPTPYLYHFSNMHKENYLSDPTFMLEHDVDPDLAAHITVINKRGVVLSGLEINSVFSEVPEEHYLDSIWYDIEDMESSITENPIYATLNLCRVLYYLEEQQVSSKKEGGEWALTKLPPSLHMPIKNALSLYENGQQWTPTSEEEQMLQQFAQILLNKIKKLRQNRIISK